MPSGRSCPCGPSCLAGDAALQDGAGAAGRVIRKPRPSAPAMSLRRWFAFSVSCG